MLQRVGCERGIMLRQHQTNQKAAFPCSKPSLQNSFQNRPKHKGRQTWPNAVSTARKSPLPALHAHTQISHIHLERIRIVFQPGQTPIHNPLEMFD